MKYKFMDNSKFKILRNLMLFEEWNYESSKELSELHKNNLEETKSFFEKNKKVIYQYYDFVFKNLGRRHLIDQFTGKWKQLEDNLKRGYKTPIFLEFVNWIKSNKDLLRKDVGLSMKSASEDWKNSNSGAKIIEEFESLIGLSLSDISKNHITIKKVSDMQVDDQNDAELNAARASGSARSDSGWNPDDSARDKSEEERFTCEDCDEQDYDMYMVNDELWKEHGNERNTLCMSCFEDRLGRKLTKNDFEQYKKAPANIHNPQVQKISVQKVR
jgi:hypothetical protein